MKTKRAWFWHWQNLQEGAPWWKYGRAWWHFPARTIGVEWLTGTRRCGASLEFSTSSDKSILIYIGIPWLIALYFSVTGLRWVRHLPGVDYSGWMTGSREISIDVSDWTIRCALWSCSNVYPHRHFNLCIDNFFLGRAKYSERLIDTGLAGVTMPEGTYRATYELFMSQWKRPRWPWPERMRRGKISVEGGVPVPGEPDSDFFEYDEDAVQDFITGDVETVEALVAAFRESIEHDRQRYGGPDWKPSRGPAIDPNWPQHFDCKCSLEG